MSKLKTTSYWSAVRKAYASLGGKYLKQAAGDRKFHIPADKSRWHIARELGYTGNRVCVNCEATISSKPGEVNRHCGMLMSADLTQAERSEIDETFGKVKVSFKQADKDGGHHHKGDPNKTPDGEHEHDKDNPEGCHDHDELADGEKKDASLEYTAHFIKDDEEISDSYWVVKKGSSPVLKVTLKQAFPGKEKTKAPIFAQQKYGDELINTINEHGVQGTVKKALKNGATVFGQFNQNNPNTLMPEPENVEDTEMQGEPPTSPQADPSLVDEDVGDEILDDEQSRTDIIELIKAALVPFIASAGDDITVQSVVAELKALFQNDNALSDFQGALDEQVDQFETDNLDEEDELESPDEIPEETLADVGGEMPPPDQQPREAKLHGFEAQKKLVAGLRSALKQHEEATEKLSSRLAQEKANKVELQRRLGQLLDDNKMLLIERTMRIRHPRCARLVDQMIKIGEVSEQERDSKIAALLKMRDDEYIALEDRVMKVHSKLVRGSNSPAFNTKGIISVIDDHRGEGNKDTTLADGPRKDSNGVGLASKVNWS